MEILKKRAISIENSHKEETEKPEGSDNLKLSILEIKEKLKELKNLHDEGLITEEEYEQKKKELLLRI